MNSSRVWELLDALGGVADEASVGELDDGLSADDAAALGEAVRTLVDDLLERCHVAHDHWGEVSEAVAAAVVASGRETYERVHARGGVLDPAEWAWQEADALLALGEPGEDPPTFVLQWLTEDLPDGVTSAWRDGHPTAGTVLDDGTVMDDSPGWGLVPAADPAWEAALEILLVEPSVAHARQAIGDAHGTSYDRVAVWLTLRDTPEPTITVYADDPDDPDGDPDGDPQDDPDGDPQDDPGDREVVLVGTYPAAELRGTDVAHRTEGYVEIVAGLLQVVADDS